MTENTQKNLAAEEAAEAEVTQEMIDEWKSKYAKVFYQNVADIDFYFRAIARPEYRDKIFNMRGTTPEREEYICKLFVLHPRDFDFSGSDAPAGIASVLSEIILEKSGFSAKGEAKEL